ncbi:MAG: hypothetical protein IKQ39_05980 [Oscillospiraceae bacterium]|nr:hypothetical protein [Oscillospiraceae bacterium]
MNETVFRRILTAVTVLGILSIIALTVYTWLLYRDCSVLTYIANKG